MRVPRFEPFAALRYSSPELEALIAPPYDVLSELDEMADAAVYVDGGVTASAESIAATRTTMRDWRIRALDRPALMAALDELGQRPTDVDHLGALVPVAGEAEAERPT